ncbi:MAG: fasciclin domain-containing protein [Planctomycetota bacterium]
MKRLFHLTLAASLFLGTSLTVRSADIVDTAVAAGQFKTLAAAVGAADLVETLKGPGPFTVFAPTDDAFASLPAGTVESLLKPENKAALSGILTYHVVSGAVKAEQVVSLTGATTVNGQRVDISTEGGVKVDNANVVKTDIICDNGVIHVIDAVILPADKNLVETAQAAGSFSTLIAAAQAAGLVEPLVGEGPLTILAPTDEAFGKLPEGTVSNLLKPENQQKLADILKYHVIPGRVYSDAALGAGKGMTLQGAPVQFKATDSGAMVNEATLVATDLDASNGVIHVIDSVLMPPPQNVDARSVIRDAIAKGSSLFNSGHHGACADLYHQTMTGLMDANVGTALRGHMTSVMSQASHTTCPTTRAWTLRHGLDQMYVQLGH